MAAEQKKWLLRVLKVLLILAVLWFIINPSEIFRSWRLGRIIARRAQCCDHQRQILLALQNYENAYGSFPPAGVLDKEGKPLYSWRVLILPFIEEESLYQKFHLDEPWDSLGNQKLLETKVDSFGCPSSEVEEPSMTNCVLITGPGTVWDGDRPCSLKDITYPDQTLLLIEVAEPVVPWTKPKDLKIDAIDPSFLDAEGNFRTNHTGIVFAAFADGHVEVIPQGEVLEALQKWSQVKQTEKREEEW